jgi:uncharacterized protein YceK
MTRPVFQRRLVVLALAVWLALAGCGAASTSTTVGGKPSAKGPIATVTATTNPAATPTLGPVCHGSDWFGAISSAGPGIDLPPQTVGGYFETAPSDPNGWSGQYHQFCTSGYPDQIESFIDQHMTAAGWTYGDPVGGCECNGNPVWTRPHDGRQVQFDEHPAFVSGTARWGVTIFTQG